MKWFLLFFLLFPAFARAATIEVCKTCEVQAIDDAIARAKAGDIVKVQSGIYAGPLFIDKPLHLIGIGRPVIDGLHKEHVFYLRADDTTIEGFVIQNSGSSYISEYAGIRVEEAKGCRLLNNIFENNTYSIYLAKVDGCLVAQNQITGNAKDEVLSGNGVHAWYSSHIVIRQNDVQRHRDGLYLEFTPDSLVEENVISHNLRYGLHFMYSPGNRYFKNIFAENQTGVAVMYSKNVEMLQNRFEKSWGRVSYGLLLKDISDSRIFGNRFSKNTVGIFADGITRILFEQNDFKNNGWAVNILGNSEENIFSKNNFYENYFDVATNTMSPLNTFADNYWSGYRGYDLDRDGRGDVPFRPMKIFGLWISRYPELVSLLASPVIEFLEMAEKVFPVLTPKSLEDKTPSMKPLTAKL
ncbi:MAG: nitrous oxide reductase family maturation protein NosD [Deltaproteobacteria bacterium]|nr:nitrous oxide reductase family maturation protein NosD [Deltaproteobacteria bacterium]